MDITRKRFLIGSMAVAAAGARRMFAAPAGTVCGTPRMKVGVLSDIHVRDEATQKVFIKALEWYRAQGVDAVLVAGDMADHGPRPRVPAPARGGRLVQGVPRQQDP